MSGTVPDTGEGADRGFSREHYIVIPVGVVLGLGILALVLAVVRRRYAAVVAARGGSGGGRRASQWRSSPSHIYMFRSHRPGARPQEGGQPQHCTVLHYQPSAGHTHRPADRDLEEALTRGAAARAGSAPSHRHGHGRQARLANRWAWANGRYLGSRREEGLNELGEAPPPYAGQRADAEAKEGVELAQLLGAGGAVDAAPTTGGETGGDISLRSDTQRSSTEATPPLVLLPPPQAAASPDRAPPSPGSRTGPTPSSPLSIPPESPPAYTEDENTPGVTTTVIEITTPARAAVGSGRRS